MINPPIANPALAELADFSRLNPLDAGEPDVAVQPRLASLTIQSLIAPYKLCDEPMARACLAGLWLHHNFLNESHKISQSLENDTGNYWHALMHRREPDAGNAAYWMRRVGEHPIHANLQSEVKDLVLANAVDTRADFLVHQDRWKPLSFIDLCETYRGTACRTEEICKKIQLIEWGLLFKFCWTRALSNC